MKRIGFVLLSMFVIGCGEQQGTQVADLPQRDTPPPPPPAKLDVSLPKGQHEGQKRYDNDKPYSGNNAPVPKNTPPTKTYVGTVRSVAGNSLTVTVDGQDKTFNVAPDVWIFTGNNPRNFPIKEGLVKVQPGNQVRVATVTKNNSEVVTSLWVTSNEANANNE
jgi:hypothetical protein